MSCTTGCSSEKTEITISHDINKEHNGTEDGDIIVSTMAGSSSGVVTFNVGGYIGSTTTTTLQKHPDSTLFKIALRSVGKLQPIVDDKGRIFIDRDGRFFRSILNFMRTGSLVLDKDFSCYKQLYSDAEYYRIGALKEAILEQKPGIENYWSEKDIIIELETDFSDPSFVKLNLPNFDYLDAKTLGQLASHPTFSELNRLSGSKLDRLQMGCELLKFGGRLLSMTSTNNNQGPLVYVLEKWSVEL